MKLSRRTLLSTPLAVVRPVELIKANIELPGWSSMTQREFQASFRGVPFPMGMVEIASGIVKLSDDERED